MDDRQYVEIFHLLFLDRLGRRIDKAQYALKGGCNLRFFFLSPRYSEDMDLDVQGLRPDVFRDRVNAILQAKAFRDVLTAHGLEIEHITESKQTATVQRWKLGVRTMDSDRVLPTKIEVSRRGLQSGTRFESVRPEILRAYGLAPILVTHYDAEAAARQKLVALAARATPQARDVFDLYLLHQSGASLARAAREIRRPVEELVERVLDTTYKIFQGQVLAYLPPEEQTRYADPRVWDAMVVTVVDALGGKAS